MATHPSILIVHFPPLCLTFFFAFCSCTGTDVPDEARETYRGTLILGQSALPYQFSWVTRCKKGCLSSSSLSLSLADRRWGRAGSPPSPPDTAPSPAKHAATSLGTNRFFKQSLPNKHNFFSPSRADANGLFKSVWRKINEPTLGLQ